MDEARAMAIVDHVRRFAGALLEVVAGVETEGAARPRAARPAGSLCRRRLADPGDGERWQAGPR